MTVVGELVVAFVLCGGLRAWLSARSLMVALLHSLVARRRFVPRAGSRPLRKALASGLGLGDLSGLARRGSTVGFHLLCCAVGLAVGGRLCFKWWWVMFLCFRLDALAELWPLCGPSFCVFMY